MDPAADVDSVLAKLRLDFLNTTGGSETMTFDKSLEYPEISDWLSKGTTTKDHLREVWKKIKAPPQAETTTTAGLYSSSTEDLNFQVCPLPFYCRSI